MDASHSASSSYHHPPAVRFPVERSVRAGLALTVLIAASGLVLVGWGMAGAPPHPWAQLLGWALWAVTAGLAAMAWRRSPRGALQWDGAQWWFLPTGQVRPLAARTAPEVHLDLQRFVLVCLPLCDAPRVWLCLERDADAQGWPALRRALYSRARMAGSTASARSESES